ncbi:hypothetical protein CYLTODRAFT_147618 [Cylindrobasidium torrendii FP15055 ss-10]|uniref:Uncharacterized protein n=1 Tax=Cylindrobasidium torrendii FP15055 ss-10 TaxID=1314674 RepID=A0A0D7AZ13_9AGAR|nr:hypothetical protein CYLTODRAFT_147618 [Cylindrobasidium torrendii FP15055 ss-10]
MVSSAVNRELSRLSLTFSSPSDLATFLVLLWLMRRDDLRKQKESRFYLDYSDGSGKVRT